MFSVKRRKSGYIQKETKKQSKGGKHDREKEEKEVNKREYDDRFHKENYKNVGFRLNIKWDKDVIAHLESMSNKADYIKRLIRQDLAKKVTSKSSQKDNPPKFSKEIEIWQHMYYN